MKIRLILLSVAGLIAYVGLANFNSKIIREAEAPKDRGQVTAPQTHAGKQHAADAAHSPAAQPPEQLQTRVPAGPPATVEFQQLLDELARKDQQIKQLLDAQETIIARERPLHDETAETAGASNTSAGEKSKQTEILTAEKEQLTAELDRTKALVEQLRQEFSQQQMISSKASRKMLKEQADRIAALSADKEKNAVELQRVQAELDQLRHRVADTQQATETRTAELIKEKEALLVTAQQRLQDQSNVANQLKAQFAETLDALAAAKKDLQIAEHKAEESVRLSAEKKQQADILNEQKTATEQALAEKKEALDKAILTIQSLRQEVIAQPQAVATVQGLLDERTQEFDRKNKEAADKIEQLNKQVAILNKNNAQAARELEQSIAEAGNARKEAVELEAAKTRAQTDLAEAEQKLATALESKKILQAQLQEKETALGGVQAKIDDLTAATTSLHDEKLGLANQLEALQADHNGLLAMKHTFEEQAAALTRAEDKLREMAALQAKNEEMSKSLAEKDTALEHAAQQTEALSALQARLADAGKQIEGNDATIKQLEQEKSNLASQLAEAQALAQDVDGLKKTIDEKSNALALAEIKVKELDGIKEQIAVAQAKAAAAETAQLTAEKNADESGVALKRCNESLTASSGKGQKLESELGEAQARIKELTDKNQSQEQQDLVPILNQQIATLRGQLAEMTAVETKSDEIKAANQKAQILQTERDGLRQELSASQDTISSLQKQLEAAKMQPSLPTAQAESAGKQPAGTGTDKVTGGAKLCPGSPAGAPVNALGCPQGKEIILEGIVFSSGTAALAPESQKELDRVVAALALAPQVKLEVAGYTDNVGDTRRNQRLSAQRAQAVSDYLAGKGVAAARLSVKGYGAENPIGDNATAAGRQQNRRIELHVMAP
ncbi:MAG: OmpA family protein [Desulfobulbus sp.]|nr:OmpA family protein [Desulfobulbus sp.]